MNAILDWLHQNVTVFGIAAPAWAFVAIAVGVVTEWALGRFAPTRCASLIALVATLLRWVFTITRIGSIPVVGTAIVRFLETVAGIDIDGDGKVGDGAAKVAMLAVVGLALSVSGCATVVPLLPQIVTYVQDAEIGVNAVVALVGSLGLDAGQVKLIDQTAAKALLAADAVAKLAQGGEAVNQAQVDAAFADFKVAFNDLMALVGPYGIHVGDVPKATRTAGGGWVIPMPTICKAVR